MNIAHFIPVDFNCDSICGLTKDEWRGGTNNWEWVTCPDCLEHKPEEIAEPEQVTAIANHEPLTMDYVLDLFVDE